MPVPTGKVLDFTGDLLQNDYEIATRQTSQRAKPERS